MFRGPAARNDLNARGLRILIPACSRRRHPATHNRTRHKKRCRIKNDFACLKNWRGLAMRCTRCGDLLLSAIALAAAASFWMPWSGWSPGLCPAWWSRLGYGQPQFCFIK